MIRSWIAAYFASFAWFVLASPAIADISVEKSDQGAVIKVDGKLFTEYLTKSGNKPVLWPIVGPGDKRVTRGYPIAPEAGETTDHIHQRGLWFTHGDINGVMFWNQEKGSGEIRHREFRKLAGGETGTIITVNDYLSPDGKKVCEDEREFVFSGDGEARVIDTKITVHASEGDLKFGDNKEGSFGLRVSDSIRVDSKKGGRLVNSEGASNDSAWGQPAKWVDYYGPVGGETMGIAILDHPSNPAHPVRWHVRPYGLFAANPFTRQAFDASQPAGSITVPKGESLTMRYRTVFHRGDEKEGRVEERWADFAKP